uniref:Putative secreted protein n=1 Tax=Anopheles marajoara TaxID=58244 RepID=A0A2M4C6R5_9DIPT
MVLLFLLFFAELQGNALDVYRLLPVDAPSLDRLRQELVDTIGWLMINARVPLLERSLELIRHLVLLGYRIHSRIGVTSKVRVKIWNYRDISNCNTGKGEMRGQTVVFGLSKMHRFNQGPNQARAEGDMHSDVEQRR